MNKGPTNKQLTWNAAPLRTWRTKHNVPREYAAEAIGVAISSYYSIESGVRTPTFETAHKIVTMTRGEVRYRDIFLNFRPEYA